MPVAEPAWRKKRTPCPFYQTGRCIFKDKCNFIHDGEIDYKHAEMRASVPAYRRTPENSVDSFSSSSDDDSDRPLTKEPIDEHTAAAPSLIFSSIYGSRPNPINRLQLSEFDLPVSPESLPETPGGRVQRKPSSSGRGSNAHTLAISSPVSSRTPPRPVSASLGIGIGGRGQGLAEVFTALATSQAHAVALPPSSAGSLPSPLSLSPKSPPHDAQEIIVADDNFTLEQFPFKLALSNQSSLLLNRTTRAAARENARRASTFPHAAPVPSPSRHLAKRSAPSRYNSVSVLPYHLRNDAERPALLGHSRSGSYKSDVPLGPDEESDESYEPQEDEEEAEEGEEESDDDEPQLVKESPSFEALQPYPRDVSIEPSPDPAQEGFSASVPVHEEHDQNEDEPRRAPRRMDSDRKLDHERLLIELEERLNIEPSRRRARSGASAASTQAASVREGVVRPTLGIAGSQSMVPKSSGVDMAAARGMLDAMFAKRAAGGGGLGPEQEEEEEEGEEYEEEEEYEEGEEEEEMEDYEGVQEVQTAIWKSGIRVNSATIENVPLAASRDEREESSEDEVEVVKEGTLRSDRTLEADRSLESDSTFGRDGTIGGGTTVDGEEPHWDEEEERDETIGVAISTPERQNTQGDDLGLGSQSSPGDQSFLPADWDIGSLDLDAHPLDLDVRSVESDGAAADRSMRELDSDAREPDLGAKRLRRGEHSDSDHEEHVDHDVRSVHELEDFGERLDHDESLHSGEYQVLNENQGVGEHLDYDGFSVRDEHPDDAEDRSLDGHSDYDGRLEHPHFEQPNFDEQHYFGEHQSLDKQEHLGEHASRGEYLDHGEPLVPREPHSDTEDYSDSDHESSDGFLTDEEPTEDYTELAEEQAVVTSSVVLRREIPRETSLPEIEATRIMSRMGSQQGSVRSRAESLVETVPEEHSVGEGHESSVGELPESLADVDPESVVEAMSGKVVRAETVSASSVVFEVPRIGSTPLTPDSPGAAAEQTYDKPLDARETTGNDLEITVDRHEMTLDEHETTPDDISRAELQDFDVVTPIASRSPEPRSPVAPPPVPEERATSISTEPRTEPEPSKRRSQLKPLRLSLLYGLKSPSSIAITPNSASPTPVASTFATPAQPESSAVYPTPATAHPTHFGSGTARSIPSSSNPRSAPSLADVEEASEGVSVYGVGRGSFGPESVSWFGSKRGSTRGSLGDSMRRSVVHARTPESTESASSPTRSTGRPQPRQLTNSFPESTTPSEDEDVRPLPVIWDDETDAGSRSVSRNGSGSDILARSPSLPVPMFEVPVDDLTPTAATMREREGSVPRYPAFVSVDGSSPRASEGRRSPLPSISSARASPEPKSMPRRESGQRKRPKPIQEPEPAPAPESVPEVERVREDEPEPMLEVEPLARNRPKSIVESDPRVEPTPRVTPVPTVEPMSEVEIAPSMNAMGAETTQETETLRDGETLREAQHVQETTAKLGLELGRETEDKQKSAPQQELTPEIEADAQPKPDARSRKWGDQSDEDSIGSLPAFDVPVPAPQAVPATQDDATLQDAPIASDATVPQRTPASRSTPVPKGAPFPQSDRLGHPRYAYTPLPDTAPLSISPRNVSPSMMQESQQEQEQEQEPYYQQIPWATPPLTAPLHLQMKMRAQQGDTAPSPWMAEHFVNSPSSLHSSQLGSMHSASSSITTPDNVPILRQSNVVKEYPVRTSSLLAKSFGNPGPGPSTMMTYSARKQVAEGLGSPILLQSPPQSRTASLVNETAPFSPKARSTSRKTSREETTSSYSAEPAQPQLDDESTVKVFSEDPRVEPDPSARSASTRHARVQSPIRSTLDNVPSSAQSLRFKPSSPPNSRSPRTPLPDHSPLQILRRNMMTRPGSISPRFSSPQSRSTNLPESRSIRHQHHGSLAPSMSMRHEDLRNAPLSAPLYRDRRSLTPAARFGGASPRPGSPTLSVQSAISQTKPLLFFAIAKNSAQEVERLLQEGEVQPNDKAGPDDLPALAFTLANEQLTDKTQIVKSLLSHGADPASVLHRKSGSGVFDDAELALSSRIEQGINPAIRYYLNRKRMTIPALQAELLEKNKFGALTRAGFSIIGQDSALDELIRVVAGHCRRQTLNPLVIVFSGGPGCGKSLLASKIGPLLHVPYFTVNMTNLRNESSLFQYISMTTKPVSPQIPLADFLKINEGQRCVVVLEEIEKAADKTVWHSLLMPWEWGKATIISPTTNEQMDIDTTQVIWIATSNSGDDATLKFFAERSRPSPHATPGESALSRLVHSPRPNDNNFTRKDYLQLMQAVRKRLGELLGSSMISRVSSVLPFLPFTEEEVLALASESLSAMREAQKLDQEPEDVDWDELLQQAVREYIPGEGARSVHRAVQRAFDEITEW